MLLLAKFIGKVLAVLNSEESPKQIAAGFALGAWIGLLPVTSLIPTLFLLFSFLINVNLAILMVAAAIFKILAFLLDPLANQLGFYLLTKISALDSFWTRLYNMPFVPYTRFNNTIVLGSFVIGFLLLVPNYFIGKKLVVGYREKLRDRVLQFKIMKVIKASSFYKYYLSYRGITGE